MADGAQAGTIPAEGLSHVRGPTDRPLIEETIPAVLARTVARFGGREAAVFPEHGIRWTWEAFAAEVDALAGGLMELGLGQGDRLGVWAPNRPEWLLAQFATARIGVILVNINPAYRVHELEYALKLTGCAALLLAERFRGSDYLADRPVRARRAAGGAAAGPAVGDPDGRPCGAGDLRLSRCRGPGPGHAARPARRGDGGARPARRGQHPVHFRHHGPAQGRDADAPQHRQQRRLRDCPDGADRGQPAATLRAVSQERATALYGVPTMFVAMLEHPDFDAWDLSSLRTGIMAGAPCPIEVMKRVQSRMNMREVTIAYGMTETSPVSFQSSTDTPLDKRVGSVGRVHPHVEVRIVDEAGATVPVGEQGELLTRGYSVMQGYWEDPGQTAGAIDADGWMHTGDLARIDAEGYCNITGRVKDMICRGGENVYPREVEEFLYTHPDVSQVQVFGVPDARLGEIVAAWVVPKPGTSPTEEGVRDFCRGQIAHFKIPALVRFRDSLPMTVTGKPQKFLMRAAMVEELGLAEQQTA